VLDPDEKCSFLFASQIQNLEQVVTELTEKS
jgi:hypothetical protein